MRLYCVRSSLFDIIYFFSFFWFFLFSSFTNFFNASFFFLNILFRNVLPLLSSLDSCLFLILNGCFCHRLQSDVCVCKHSHSVCCFFFSICSSLLLSIYIERAYHTIGRVFFFILWFVIKILTKQMEEKEKWSKMFK